MKRMMTLALILACILILTACNNQKGQDYLNAKVVEITDTEIIAVCIDEPANQLTGTTISVSKNVISAAGIPEIEADDEIRVVFDFDKVNELSYPVQIEHVYAIYLLDENGNVISN